MLYDVEQIKEYKIEIIKVIFTFKLVDVATFKSGLCSCFARKYVEYSTSSAEIWADICPWAIFVPISEQLPESKARGQL